MARKPTISPEQRAERLRAAQEMLERGVGDLADSETFRRYLTAMSRFHRYSFSNSLLIWLQNPDATRCASYNAWRKVGRQVRKGEVGLKIFAPLKYSRELSDEEKQQHFGTTDIEAKAHGIKGFTVVSTFDVSQTDGEPLPESPARLLADSPDADGLPEAMISAAESLRFTVKQPTLAVGGRNGSFSLDVTGQTAGTVEVAANRSNAQRAKTLAHEMAHGLNHANEATLRAAMENQWTKAACELVAEGTAYVVCAALGLDTSEYSFGYLAAWRATPDVIKKCAEQIQASAHQILDAVDAAAGGAPTVEEEAA